MAAVYAIRNLANGNVYVGSTVRAVRVRKREHWKALRGGYHHNLHLQSAWELYGEGAFAFEPILTLECSEAAIRQAEDRTIEHYRNVLGVGRVYTQRGGTENPMSNPETAARTGATLRERYKDPAFRANFEAGIQRRSQNPEWLAGQVERNRRAHTPAATQKRRETRVANHSNPFWACPPDGGEPFLWTRGQGEFARHYGLTQSIVSRVLSGALHQTGGWRLKPA